MNERLQQLMSAEGITQSAFADTIKVARASVSHVMSGRNMPSYDFLCGVVKAFPNVNIDWLLTGNGTMYKSDQNTGSGTPVNDHQIESDNSDTNYSESDYYAHDSGVSSKAQLKVDAPVSDSLFPDSTPMEINVAQSSHNISSKTLKTEIPSNSMASSEPLGSVNPKSERKISTSSPVYDDNTSKSETFAAVAASTGTSQCGNVSSNINSIRHIKKIVVFYDDNSYQEIL